MPKMRLDNYILEHGFTETKSKAQAIIMAGNVYVNNQKSDKCGTFLKEEDVVEVRETGLKYVSRGGLKLEKAIEKFEIDLEGKTCMDIGASTGGFTDCMLQNGAKKVYAIDVGYGQLAWKLRQDARVVNIEKTNIRYINTADFRDVDFVSVDVSFISLKLIFPVISEINPQEFVVLIKPQFEAGREKVGKGGIVREKSVHIEVIQQIMDSVPQGYSIHGLTFSPVKGADGNIEYLLHFKKGQEKMDLSIEKVVDEAHESHNKIKDL
ncbi:MAG: TlyA family RNA methyltransferase [Oscillospiraceae bacterium]|nr:TlyA family RNA methyltransferase [Oscillospiraceae bacterium]